MSDLFKNKYRVDSIRLKSYNYQNEGIYFITICTKNRLNYFGINDSVEAQCIAPLQNPIAPLRQIAYDEWHKTFELRPDMNIKLGEFVVMPNHIHGIIIIGKNEFNSTSNNENGNKFGPQSKNLASIIRGYKSAITTYARKNNIEFNWQPNYYEHIIRSSDDFERISIYIKNNPQKWADDMFYLP